MYRDNDAPAQVLVHAVISAAISLRFDNYSSGSNTIEVDMARMRAAANPPPTVTAGTPQTYMP
jgi:hypothetical protein